MTVNIECSLNASAQAINDIDPIKPSMANTGTQSKKLTNVFTSNRFSLYVISTRFFFITFPVRSFSLYKKPATLRLSTFREVRGRRFAGITATNPK
jgi:hypothetical protein